MGKSRLKRENAELLVIGKIYDQELERLLLQISRIGVPNSINTVQINLVRGMCAHLGNANVKILSTGISGLYPHNCTKAFIAGRNLRLDSQVRGRFIGYINLPIFKEISATLGIIIHALKWLYNTRKNADTRIVLTYNLYTPILLAIRLLKVFSPKLSTLLVFGDLAGEYIATSGRKGLFLHLEKYDYDFQLRLANKFDAYGLCTKWMTEAIDCTNKPYCIVEVIVDSSIDKNMKAPISSSEFRKVIMYAGTLKKEYNIDLLLEALSLLKQQDYELWIYGSGEAEIEREIRKLATQDERIKFFGYVSKDEILEAQAKADVFVNPRTNSGVFTKYSFPSKTAEVILSERPLVCFKL
ncbi:MAG: glycosyltransferase family 4 protein, partial [Lentisphaerae bacterium]|nr:glycosyltransferase family 4 protein [Lentisphaerota bacterium]